ncbi:MAG TPA: Gfo/Idh/MocA family oxidoreductase [Verrucomicrobiota bacterium]|jgi:predicted dehydrogenase|nr:Gfo/Idh/MocA family oxidoreductase [Verrucomicrobiota bacterium]OQC27289.1 MAG: Inositol 2-dehydrogenase/D-chiro-inositol 3-dehydrogenase [Verrucomicrobia bacterium ADurb.Bin063]HRR64179.1 Gfo/Idh/MocA family oxidoreductase [Candidatus Paceibacterota bacterium]HNR70461.1 Gfo/Idh/MocA family oxidoreductase [Verrucomicrobiota bacterium]HNS69103.1 Gfo/Idh/MocA family oxidoreductase [Verrucomicrobiota bacterium]
MMTTASNNLASRRDFLKTSALVGGALAVPAFLPKDLYGQEKKDVLRVGLIGCGGRGSGAASQALNADPNVVLTALGDAFEDQVQRSLQGLQKQHPDKVKVTPEKCFSGLNAYQQVIDSGVDVVLLAAPPGFRPAHLKAAVAAGKHIFCEKPMATDAPGVRSVLESVEVAKAKKLSLVAGFCWRYELARREFYQRIHEGAIGDLRAVYATYYAGPVKPMPAPSERPADMGDLEWQLRNWYNFTWLSGDGYVEQACHSVDKVAWAFKDRPPLKAVAVGGRQTPNHQGNIFDHMFVVYEYPEEARAFVGQRQVGNTYTENSDYLMGAAGFGKIQGWAAPHLKGREEWRYKGPKSDMYQNEHNELFASIRSGKPINDGEWMTHSTLMGIMGRMAAYTGQEITWEQALNSQENLVPAQLDWKMKLDFPPMAMPGVTKFI